MQLSNDKMNYLNGLDDELSDKEANCNMKIPEIENKPHLLISKVRKRYFDYLIQLLSKNCGIKSDEKRIPSSIWRCARKMEVEAVEMCMVVSLYRKSIFKIINRIKHETTKGRIFGDLKTFLKLVPSLDKKIQTDFNESTFISCSRKRTHSEANSKIENYNKVQITTTKNNNNNEQNGKNNCTEPKNKIERLSIKDDYTQIEESNLNTQTIESACISVKINGTRNRMSSESTSLTCHSADNVQDDEIFKEMEELFKSEKKEEDIFDQNFNDRQFKVIMDEIREFGGGCNANTPTTPNTPMTPIPVLTAAPEKSLDERLAEFPVPIIEEVQKIAQPEKPLKPVVTRTKWICEYYFRKKNLCEKLDELCETKNKKLEKVKSHFLEHFGVDSDDEQAPMSPQDNSLEFINSCKERIAPWIVKSLMGHYMKGRIKSKHLFKGCAKYILKLLIDGDQYPSEPEVHYFINEYLKYHPVIRCESDFY